MHAADPTRPALIPVPIVLKLIHKAPAKRAIPCNPDSLAIISTFKIKSAMSKENITGVSIIPSQIKVKGNILLKDFLLIPIAVHADVAKRLNPIHGPMLPIPIEIPAAKSCNAPFKQQIVAIFMLISNAIINPKIFGVTMIDCVSNISCKILLLKKGWRATDKHAACAGKLDAIPATKLVKPIAKLIPIFPKDA